MPEDRFDAARAAVARRYRSPQGQPATVDRCRASAGAGEVIGI
jgi:galactokinase